MMMVNALTKDLDYELFQYYRRKLMVQFVDNQIKQNSTAEVDTKALRLIKDGRLSLVSGTKNIPDKTMLDRAKNALPFASKAQFSFHDLSKYNQKSGSMLNKKADKIDAKAAIELGKALLDKVLKMKEFSDFSYRITVASQKEDISIKNASMNLKEFDRSEMALLLIAKRILKDDILDLYFVDTETTEIDKLDYFLEKNEFAKMINLSKKIVTLDGGKYPVIFHPETLGYMLLSLMEGLSMKNVYEKMSPLQGKMNQKIFNERISIIDDPFFEKGTKRALFDDEGVPCTKKFLVENGILKSYMTDLDYAARSGIEPTGNGFRDSLISEHKILGTQPNIMPTNILIPGDEKSVEFDEMIKDIKEGLVIYNAPDCWMGNIVSGDISGNITIGFKIENGKLTGRVKNKRFAASIYDLFGSKLVTLSKSSIFTMSGSDRFPYILSKDVSIN